jgi:hypothetical protein
MEMDPYSATLITSTVVSAVVTGLINIGIKWREVGGQAAQAQLNRQHAEILAALNSSHRVSAFMKEQRFALLAGKQIEAMQEVYPALAGVMARVLSVLEIPKGGGPSTKEQLWVIDQFGQAFAQAAELYLKWRVYLGAETAGQCVQFLQYCSVINGIWNDKESHTESKGRGAWIRS